MKTSTVRFPSLPVILGNRASYLALAAVLLLVLGGSAQAASQNWNGGSVVDGNWGTVSNWVGGATPGSTSLLNSTDVATINATIANTWGNSALNPIVIDSATQNIGGITFDTSAGSYFIGSTGGNSLLLSSGGTIQILSTLTATNAVETINAPLVIEGAAGTYTFANNSANGAGAGAGTLNFGGGITGGAAGATVLTLSGTNTNTISGIIGNGTATTLGITKSGAGTWVLSGANIFTGATTISGGILNYQNGTAFGTNSAITVSSGATAQVQGGITGGSQAMRINGTGATGATGALENVSGTNSYAGLLTLGSASTISSDAGTLNLTNTGTIVGTTTGLGITLAGAGNGSIAGIINGGISGTAGAGTLTKSGAGTWVLSGTNTYTGATTISGGTLKAGIANAFGSNSAVTLANTAGVTLDVTGYNTSIGSLTGGGATGGNVTLGTAVLTTGGDNTSPAAYAGVISGPGGSLTKNGTGTQILAGANTYTGGTTISGGALQLNNTNAVQNSVVTISVNNGLTFGSAGAYAMQGLAGANNLALSAIDASIASIKLGTFYYNNGGLPGTNVYSGALSGAGNVSMSGINSQTFSGNNSYTGTTTLTNGNATSSAGPATLLTTGAGGVSGTTPFGTGAILINGGVLAFAPSAAVAVADTGVSATTGAQFTYAGGAFLNLTKNGANTLSYTIGNATPSAIATNLGQVLNRTNNGTLIIQTSAADLGTGTANNENFLVTGTAPTLHAGNNMVNASIVTLGGGTLTQGDFLTYGANGFTSDSAAYTVRSGAIAGGTTTVNEISNVNAAATFSGTNSTNALLVQSTFTATLTGAVLNVGDNTAGTQAGVILNGGTITGGTLNFGLSEGIIYGFKGASTVSSVITGSGGLTLAGNQTINLGANGIVNTFSGGLNILAGVNLGYAGTAGGNNLKQLQDATLGITSNVITLNGGQITANSSPFGMGRSLVLGAAGGTFTGDRGGLASNVSGSGLLTITGNGGANQGGGWPLGNSSTYLAGTNTATGGTVLGSTIIEISTLNVLGASTSPLLFDNGILSIIGTGVTNFGSHSVTFAPNNFVGIDIQSAANTFTISQALNQTSGGFYKFGLGTVLLTSANTYTGGTNLMGGTVQVGNGTSGSLSSSTNLYFDGGTLDIVGNSSGSTVQTLGNVTMGMNNNTSDQTTGGGTLIVDSNTGTSTTVKLGSIAMSNSAGSGYGSGSQSGNSFDIVAKGSGTTTITTTTAPDTSTGGASGNGIYGGRIVYTDATGINWATSTGTGTYTLAGYSKYQDFATWDSGNGAPTDNVVLIDGAGMGSSVAVANTLKIDTTQASQSFNLGGGSLSLTSGGLLFTGANAYSITNGLITSALASTTQKVGNGGTSLASTDLIVQQYGTGNLTIGANLVPVITDPTTNANLMLTKAGPGTLTLTGNNLLGQVFLNGGILSVGSDANLGGASGAVIVTSTTTSASVQATTLPGGLIVGSNLLGRTVTNIVFAAGTYTITLSGNANTNLTDGTASWATMPYRITLNGGTLQMTGNLMFGESYAGGSAGTTTANLGLTFANAGSTLDITNGDTVFFASSINNNNGGGHPGLADLTLTSSVGGGTFAFGTNSSSPQIGTINLNGATLRLNTGNALDMAGGGLFNTINMGTSAGGTLHGDLQINSAGNFTSTGAILLAGLNSSDSGAVVENGNGSNFTATLAVINADNETFAGSIANTTTTGTGALSFLKGGAGSFTLSGTNTYTGTTTVSQGTLIAGSNHAFGTNSVITFNDVPGAILSLNNFNNTVGSLSGGGTLGDGVTLGSATLTIGSDNTNQSYAGAITGSGGLTKIGTGTQTIVNALGYAGPTTVNNGGLTTTLAASGTPFSTGAITINGGTLTFAPTGSASAIAYTGASAATGTLVTYGGNAAIALTKGTQTSVTATLGGGGAVLNRTNNGVLVINPGTNDLGSNENLVINGTAPVITNGMVNASIVGLNTNTTAGTGDFLTYGGAYTGFGVSTYTAFAAGGTPTSTQIANVTGNGTLSASSAAYALLVQNGLTATLGGTVTIGDGTHAAGVILNGGTVTGGTLAFGTSEGIIYGFKAADSVASTITGSGGVTFAGNQTITLSGANTYTGVTAIDGATVSVASLANGGSNSNIGAGGKAAANLVINGGTIAYTGAAAVTDRLFTIGSQGATITSSTAALTFSNSGTIGVNGAYGYQSLTLGGANGGNLYSVIANQSANNLTSLAKTGNGTWVILGANSYSGGTTIASGGTLQVGGGAVGGLGNLGSGGVVDNGTLTYDLAGNLTESNQITGTGALKQNGSGTLLLAATNIFTGATTIANGAIQMANAYSLALSSSVTVNINNGLTFSSGVGSSNVGGVDMTRAFVIQALNGTGNLVLQDTGANAARLYIGGPYNPSFLSTQNGTYSGILSGSGGVTVSDYQGFNNRVQTFTNPLNSYTGVNEIDAANLGTATLAASYLANGGSNSSIGSSSNAASNLIFGGNGGGNGGAILQYTGAGNSTDRLFTIGDIWGSSATLTSAGSGAVAFTNTGAIAFASNANSPLGVVSSDYSLVLNGANLGANTFAPILGNYTSSNLTSLIKNGNGTWFITGANTYTGTTKVDAGILNVASLANGGSTSSIGASTSWMGNLIFGGVFNVNALTVATLQYTGATAQSTDRLFTIGDGNGSNAVLDASGTGSGTLSFTNTGNINIVNTALHSLTLAGSNTGANTLAPNITDFNAANPTSLFKRGVGTWNISGTNTYTGTTLVNAGNLTSTFATSGTPFGTGNVQINGGTLAIAPSAAGAIADTAATAVAGSTFTYAGNATLALAKNGTSLTLTAGNAGATGNTAGLGSVLVRSNNGVLVLQTAATDLGSNESFKVNGTAPTLSNTIVNSSIVGLGVSASGMGDFLTYGASGFSTATYGDTNFAAATNTVIENVNAPQALTGATSVFALKTNSTITATGFTLNVGNYAATATATQSPQAGVILNGGGITGGTLAFGSAEGIIASFNGPAAISSVITGSGGVTFAGNQTLTLSGASSYTGVTTINGNTVSVTSLGLGGANGTLGASTNVVTNLVINGGTLAYDSTASASGTTDRLFTIGSAGATIVNNNATPANTMTFNNAGSLAVAVSASTLGIVNGDGNQTLTLDGANTGNNVFTPIIVNGSLANSGTTNQNQTTLIKNGAGTWILAGNNTYTGGTFLNSGILQVGNGAGTGQLGQSWLVNNGSLVYNTTSGITDANIISGTGSLTDNGTGTISLTGGNTYSGATTIAAGATLQIGNGSATGALGSGSVTVNGTGTLAFNPTANVPVVDSHNIAGTGNVKQVANLTFLTGNSTYTGITTISGGTLNAANWANGGSSSSIGQSTSAAANLVFNGGALQYTGTSNASTDHLFTMNGAGTINSSGAGTLSFTNAGTIATTSANTLTLTGSNTGANTLASILGSTNNLTKGGAGTWIVSGANTFTGTTTVQSGTLSVGSVAAAATAQPLGEGSVVLGNAALPYNSAVLQYTGGSATLGLNITAAAGDSSTISNTGGGTLTLAGSITKTGISSAATALTLTSGTFIVSGQITGSYSIANSDFNVKAATVTLTNANNNYFGATTVSNAGTLIVSGSISATTAVNITSSGTVTLGASNAINSAATLTLAGGTFNAQTFTNTLGVLTLSADSAFDLGSGAAISFANSSSATWSNTLALTGFASGTSLRFGTNSSGLTSGQLADFTATGVTSFGLDSNGWLVAVPEPATWALLAFSLTTVMVLRRRRRL